MTAIQVQEELKVVLAEAIKKLDESQERPPRLMTEADAARYLSVSSGTMRHWREMGTGPDFLILRGGVEGAKRCIIRYDVGDVDKWLLGHPRRKETTWTQ